MPHTDTRHRILHAALDAFSEFGFEKASLRKIAERAGIRSPALIYWYFENKEALLKAVITELTPLDAGLSLLDKARASGPQTQPKQILRRLGHVFLSALEDETLGRILRIVATDLLRRPDRLDEFATQVPSRAISTLAAYLDWEVTQGRLRPHDTQVVARWFLSGLVLYAIHREFLPALRPELPPPERFLDSALDALFEGLAQEPKEGGTP